jgi:uncharacterized protein YfbU (UPF0304 family)
MKLTRVERLMLANQFLILEKLYPEHAGHYEEACQAVERGFEGHYWLVFQGISEDTLSEEQCREVLDVMTMFSCLKASYDDLQDKTGIKPEDVRFDGFDGNNEGEMLSFANFYCRGEGGKFTDIVNKQVPNSHSPRIDLYRRMLRVFKTVRDAAPGPRQLSKESLQQIVAARPWNSSH